MTFLASVWCGARSVVSGLCAQLSALPVLEARPHECVCPGRRGGTTNPQGPWQLWCTQMHSVYINYTIKGLKGYIFRWHNRTTTITDTK